MVKGVAKRAGIHRQIAIRKPFICPATKAKRLQWARDNKGLDWHTVLFTDEVSLELGQDKTRPRVSCRAGEAFESKNLRTVFRSERASLMVWAGIGWDYKTPLHRVILKPSTSDGKSAHKGRGFGWTEICAADPQRALTASSARHGGCKRLLQGCRGWYTSSQEQTGKGCQD